MKLRERIGLAIAGKRFFGIPQQGTSAFIDRLGVPAPIQSRQLYGNYQGITYAAISLISDGISRIEQYVVSREDENKRLKHQFLRLLENPNPNLTKSEFFAAHQAFKSIAGEVFWYFALGEQTKLPKEVYLIRPDRVKVMVNDDGTVAAYKVSKDNSGEYVLLSPHEVYHHKYFNPNDPYRGLGPLQAGLNYIQTETFASRFSRNFLYNNATPSGVIRLNSQEGKGEVSKEAYDKFKREWRDGMSGAENAGKVAIVRGMEVEFTKVGLSLGDIDLSALKKMTDEAILKMFRVPKALLGESDQQGLGRANIESLEYSFAKYVLEPNMNSIDDAVQKLIKRFYKDDVVVRHENIIPEDKEYLLKYKEAAVDRWLNRDELRIQEGYEPLGATDLYVEANKFPVISSKKSVKFIKSATPIVEKEEVPDWDVTDKSDTSRHEVFRKQTVENLAEPYYVKFKKEVIKILRDQEEKVLARFGKSVTAKDFEEANLDLGEETLLMVAALYPIMVSLAEDTGNLALEFVGIDAPFIFSEANQKLLREQLTRMSYDFNSETLNSLSKTLAEGFAQGDGQKELKKRVKKVFNDGETWRNERIARSETHRDSVYATELAYQQSGYIKYKKWYANPGACQYCSAVDGKVEPVGQSFFMKGDTLEGTEGGKYDLTYETVESAHLHPNCKCTILPLTEKKSYKGLDIHEVKAKEVVVQDDVEDKFEKQFEKLKDQLTNEVLGKVAEMDDATKRLKEVLDDEQ